MGTGVSFPWSREMKIFKASASQVNMTLTEQGERGRERARGGRGKKIWSPEKDISTKVIEVIGCQERQELKVQGANDHFTGQCLLASFIQYLRVPGMWEGRGERIYIAPAVRKLTF